MIQINETVVGVWFMGLPTPGEDNTGWLGDYMVTLQLAEPGKYYVVVRLRWYLDDKTWESEDEKIHNERNLAATDNTAAIEYVRRFLEKVPNGPLDYSELLREENESTADFAERMLAEDWADGREATEDEAALITEELNARKASIH